eukprot:NODE_129_length_18551_cov_0.317039.p8 type:complete len:166 gc:universal NODE_129_length_18551_cov_0.317039:5134-4637(-)
MVNGINRCNPEYVKSKEITSRYSIQRHMILYNLPSFNTSQMISSLSSKVARYMATMPHYTFKERLKFKCKQRGKTIIECSESFTSQTYTRCGTLKKTNLESYSCTKCHLEIYRDHMAARNIYIKYLHPYSIPPQGSASVSNHCNGASRTASFSVEILGFLRNQDF